MRWGTVFIDHGVVPDPRSFPPPPMRAALARLAMFGPTALINLARRNVTWFLGDDSADLGELVVAACLNSPPMNHTAVSEGRFVVGRVRFPYMVVLRVDNERAHSHEFTGLVADVASELRELVPSATFGTGPGGALPPTSSGGTPPAAAPAQAAVYVPPATPTHGRGAA